MKKVKICKYCSNFDKNEIKAYAKNNKCKLSFGCMGKCKRKNQFPELATMYFGEINDKLVICASKEEFFNLINTKD